MTLLDRPTNKLRVRLRADLKRFPQAVWDAAVHASFCDREPCTHGIHRLSNDTGCCPSAGAAQKLFGGGRS